MPELIRMGGIHLVYGSTPVLCGADFQLNSGEIHALIGERRCGKSSLMRILAGEIQPQKGTIMLEGKAVNFSHPHGAVNAGIGMVHQNLQILPNLNAVENIFTRTLPKIWGTFHKYARFVQDARTILARIGQGGINLAAAVGTLPIAQQQAVEIARIIALNPRVVILDQIAERLNETEMERLIRLMQEFRNEGRGIIYITENVNEVFEVADRVTVLEDGYRKSTEDVADLDRLKLVRMAFNLALDQQKSVAPVMLRQFNESVIRDLPVGVLIFDQKDRLFHANEEAERLCGRTQLELSGLSLESILDVNVGSHAADILNAIDQSIKRVWEGVRFGSEEFTRIQTDIIQDENFAVLGRVLLVQDATLDQTMAEYLTKAEKLESTAAIAAGVAHEVNNPLATIRNYVEILRMKNTDADMGDKLSRISTELDRIVEIISSLLSFSKIRKENRELVNLQELLRETETLLRHRFRAKNISVKLDNPAAPIIVKADENRLKQVLVNILVNSIEATLEGGSVLIALQPNPQEETISISIRDNGSGIPQHTVGQIFQPFFSTKASRTNTGLGLSICRHIVEAHGGTMKVDSAVGEYTDMQVILPMVK